MCIEFVIQVPKTKNARHVSFPVGMVICENRTCELRPCTFSFTFSRALSNLPWTHLLECFGDNVSLTQKASTFVSVSVDIFEYTPVCTFAREFDGQISCLACSARVWHTNTERVEYRHARNYYISILRPVETITVTIVMFEIYQSELQDSNR